VYAVVRLSELLSCTIVVFSSRWLWRAMREYRKRHARAPEVNYEVVVIPTDPQTILDYMDNQRHGRVPSNWGYSKLKANT
jgi:hypothetical protein